MYLLMQVRGARSSRSSLPSTAYEPDVTLVIPAYNERAVIEQKVANCRALDYPPERLTLLFVTDGSTDGTPEILQQYPDVTVLHQPRRAGKAAALNRALPLVQSPITVFCDANAMLNPAAIRNLVRHFASPEVGCVAGEKRVWAAEMDGAASAGESLYWRYESAVKRWESTVGSVMGAAGELFAVRTALYEPIPPDTLLDDFVLSFQIAARGYRLVYEPEAFAVEKASASIGDEWKRKVRVCAGGFQAIGRLAPLLNPLRYGFLSFQYISHRVLRWTITPVLLVLLLPVNAWLARTRGKVYRMLLGVQIIFYLGAAIGWLLETRKMRLKLLFVPFYFTMMNLAVFAGMWRFLRGRQSVLWERPRRLA